MSSDRFLSFLLSGSFLVLIISCAKLPSPEPGQEFEHFTGDFEDSSIASFHGLIPYPENVVIVSDTVRRGNHAVRFTLRPGDVTNNGNRVELGVHNCAKYGTEVYYGWSFMIDTSWTDTHYCLISQWQNLPNYQQGEEWNNTFPSPPPLALIYIDGVIKLQWNEKVVNENVQTIAERPISKGVWCDVIFRVFWSDQEDGYVEAWMNDVPMIDDNDHRFEGRTLYNRAGNYFKFGLYRGSDTDEYDPLISWCDELHIGSSYEEVRP
jgi:hypothetical protein